MKMAKNLIEDSSDRLLLGCMKLCENHKNMQRGFDVINSIIEVVEDPNKLSICGSLDELSYRSITVILFRKNNEIELVLQPNVFPEVEVLHVEGDESPEEIASKVVARIDCLRDELNYRSIYDNPNIRI